MVSAMLSLDMWTPISCHRPSTVAAVGGHSFIASTGLGWRRSLDHEGRGSLLDERPQVKPVGRSIQLSRYAELGALQVVDRFHRVAEQMRYIVELVGSEMRCA